MFKVNIIKHWRRSGDFVVNWTYFTPFSSVSITEFEQVNFSWESSYLSLFGRVMRDANGQNIVQLVERLMLLWCSLCLRDWKGERQYKNFQMLSKLLLVRGLLQGWYWELSTSNSGKHYLYYCKHWSKNNLLGKFSTSWWL